jgi:FtsP/CotA-like multicopper oxidase with cupredoxin domain
MNRVLLLVISLVVVLCGAGAAGLAVLWARTSASTAGTVDFARPLAVPPLAESHVDAAGRRVFDLEAEPGEHDFGGGPAPTWGFNGGYLGPTLRATRGETVLVNVRNRLPEATTVHWHGMHLPAVMDGGPHQPIPPGGIWSPSWRIDQPAATLWYHPHPHGATARHVYRGLAGMFIVDDPATSVADLPHTYGVDDFPVIVQDKRLTASGRLSESRSLLGDVGILGDTIAVNGTVAPYLTVTTTQVRLRLLNASNARIYDIGIADGRAFALVGTDGGLLARRYDTSRVRLSPGERAEIVVAVRPGERPVLRSFPTNLGIGAIGDHFVGGDDTLDLLQLRTGPRLEPRPEVPARLVDVPRLDPASAAQRRSFTLTGKEINGRSMDMGRIDATVIEGSVEIWQVRNNDGTPHNFHLHGVSFQVLSVDGGGPPPELSGWKDTIYLPPDVRFDLIARFGDYPDPGTPYMFHCHVLFHEDSGMMGQYLLVRPG